MQNASLNKIIKNASISKGKFYYHFEDKKTGSGK
ncbi:TetR/AcrR family transcriptional regulator [Methanobacterium sp. SMA-27]